MSEASAIYERIGPGYASQRQPEPRWVARISEALYGVRTLVNIGAGSGSYEPDGCRVIAVEPSPTMIGQRRSGSAPVVRAVAEALPFPDGCFDAALAVLTVHHWLDATRGLGEMRRVAGRQVVLTWDPGVFAREFWLVRDYLPEIGRKESGIATLASVSAGLGSADVRPLAVPVDCIDGFLGAFWRRPHAYLDPTVRAAMSGLALLDPAVVDKGLARLADDLNSGAWLERNGALLSLSELDLGYRLVVAGA